MHEYCAIHAMMLLKYRKDMVTQKYFIPLISYGAGDGTRTCGIFEEKEPDLKRYRHTAPHNDLFRL